MNSNQAKNKHLLWRAAFGPITSHIPLLATTPPADLLNVILKSSAKKPRLLKISEGAAGGLVDGIKDLGRMEKLTREQQKQRRKESAENIKSLNLLWLDEMVNSEAQLREKMSLFWHGHFACRVVNIYFQQDLLHTIRQNALGNFGDLLRGVSKSPAMLSFLNNQQNRKQHPNENFARELMELFTMGRGNYTEEDVKESARAFTGWGFNLAGEFVFRNTQHDTGQKVFLGRKGNFDGDDIITLILEQKATATFLTRKIYAFLVNEDIDEQQVAYLAGRFYAGNYDIGRLLRDIFSSEFFYAAQNTGCRIKSPVELIAGIRRMVPLELDRPDVQLLLQRGLGQLLFYPPNVAGWPGGRSWIDSSSLLLRMRTPQILASGGELSLRAKSDDDVMMGREGVDKIPKIYKVNAQVDWSAVVQKFSDTAREELAGAISDILLPGHRRIAGTILDRYANKDSREAYIRSVCIALMSTPDYQLC